MFASKFPIKRSTNEYTIALGQALNNLFVWFTGFASGPCVHGIKCATTWNTAEYTSALFLNAPLCNAMDVATKWFVFSENLTARTGRNILIFGVCNTICGTLGCANSDSVTIGSGQSNFSRFGSGKSIYAQVESSHITANAIGSFIMKVSVAQVKPR